jgi:hypothetical protein
MYLDSLKNHPIIPKVPQTPGPRKVEDIQKEAKSRFAGIICISKEPEMTFEDYLSEYDYCEEYSEIKSYSKRPFQRAYRGKLRQYQNYLCVITDEDEIEHYFVVVKRLKGELDYLIPYCRCLNCRSWKLNPIKYVWCDYCVGCIKAGPGFANPQYLTIAKNLHNIKHEQNGTSTNNEACVGSLNELFNLNSLFACLKKAQHLLPNFQRGNLLPQYAMTFLFLLLVFTVIYLVI